jgi:hypothetical protein
MRAATRIRTTVAGLAAAVALLLPSGAGAEPAVSFNASLVSPELTFFDTTTPGRQQVVPVTGIPTTGTFQFVAADLRPKTGELYVVAVEDPTMGGTPDDSVGTLWKIDLGTHAATLLGTEPFSTTLPDAPAKYGLDFHPGADRLRLVTSTNLNLRINPDTAALAATDSSLTSSGAHTVWALGYDQNVAGTSQTTAFAIDTAGDQLMRLGGVNGTPSANGGVLTAVGALGFDAGMGVMPSVSFDISPTTGTAYLTAFDNFFFGPTNSLYTVNLATGTATNVDPLGGSYRIALPLGLHLLPASSIAVATPAVSAGESGGSATVTVARLGNASTPATVAFSTADGTATAGTDYVAVSGTLAFAPGVTSRTIEVPLKPDASVESGETFAVTLSGVTGATAGDPLTATVTIADDDVAPVPVADTTRPSVLLGALTPRVLRLFNSFGTRLQFSCSEACSARGTVKLGRRVVGASTRAVQLDRAGVSSALVKPSTAGRRLLTVALGRRGIQTVRLTYTLVATDAAGNRTTKLASLLVRG